MTVALLGYTSLIVTVAERLPPRFWVLCHAQAVRGQGSGVTARHQGRAGGLRDQLSMGRT
jgi:hypothetical protein